MKREEAIRALERADDYVGIHYINGVEEAYINPHLREAVKVALSALRPVSRERVEKVWSGEWKPTEYPFMNECEDCSVCGYRTVWGHGFDFCPACGAAQTDEAVDMVMERLEALKDG